MANLSTESRVKASGFPKPGIDASWRLKSLKDTRGLESVMGSILRLCIYSVVGSWYKCLCLGVDGVSRGLAQSC
ncbi:hypothetical protein D8674_008600 [Pyrus ussuriensis x Pyrus communis]|uniref:Uncharacterized protein n=1 Tax=Pyrus ussuriensis x Pyrus communis TaxID=2448454 RepID=A0A5N5HXW8_9ROSA|nr:hypothetical protein D8674_008600 [Pyrus ussuriensis x Pyrus communis]